MATIPRGEYNPEAEVAQFRPLTATGPNIGAMMPHVTADMFGAQIGKGLQAIGTGLERTADSFWDIEKQNQDLQADKIVTDYNKNSVDKIENFSLLPGDQAHEQLGGFVKGLTDDRDKMVEKLPPYMRNKVLNETRGTLLRDSQRAANHTATAFRDYQRKQFQVNIDNTTDDLIANSDDPTSVERNLRKAAEEDGKDSALIGISGPEAELKSRQMYDKVAKTAVKAILQKYRDPEKAQRLLDRLKGAIPAETYLDLNATIYQKRNEFRGQNEVKPLVKNSMAAPGNTLPGVSSDPLTGEPVVTHERTLTPGTVDPTTGEPRSGLPGTP